MTIGPEPITRTLEMSVLRGMVRLLLGGGHEVEEAVEYRATAHQERPFAAVMRSRKRPNKSPASSGTDAPSRGYCTENAGRSSARRPSTTSSLRSTCDTT